jgi:ABC-type transport system involved in cytochrome c biogenesis ATPase subunit
MRRIKGMLFWLIGDLSSSTQAWPSLVASSPCSPLRGHSGAISICSHAGDDIARALGVAVPRVTLLMHALRRWRPHGRHDRGQRGLCRLVVPHALRWCSETISAAAARSALCGGTLLASRIPWRAPLRADQPVGIITALIGVPTFLVLAAATRMSHPTARTVTNDSARTAATLVPRLTVSVPGRTLCSGFDLDVEAPARRGFVVGPNGAGKTTLLSTLAGLRHRRGEIAYDGSPFGAVAARASASPRLAAAGHRSIIFRRRCSKRCWSGRHPIFRDGNGNRRRCRPRAQALARVGMQRLRGARIGSLSGGERRRVAWRAACQEPRCCC